MPVLPSSGSPSTSYNLAQIRASLRSELKTDKSGKIWSDLVLNDYINQGYLKLQRDGLFAWNGNENGSGTLTLVGGTQEYALPSDFGWLRLALNGSTQLIESSFGDVKIRNPNNTQGTPSNYYINGDYMGLDPVPSGSATVTLYYRKILASLTSDSSTIGLNSNFVPAIVKYAAYLAWSSPRGNADTASQKLGDYQIVLRTLMSAYRMRDLATLQYKLPRRFSNGRYNNTYYSDRVY